ncbi:MAG: acetylxylan esterase [Ignavibacteriae bacterium]|nr:acetylxylan esterase [Ignavibacteriota bacterium]
MRGKIFFIIIIFIFSNSDAQVKEIFEPPVKLSAKEDHARIMKLLGMESIRRGPSGNPEDSNYANVDESKASPYTSLPDPLIFNNGEKVTSSEMWLKKRRSEIVEEFEREIYGRLPSNIPKVNWEVTKVENSFIENIPVIKKHLLGKVDNSIYPLLNVEIKATLVVPQKIKEPVPIMIHLAFDLSLFPNFDLSKLPPDFYKWQSQLLNNGWGFVELIPTSFQEDNGGGLTNGIIGLCNLGKPRKLDDWGTLQAWAWGASKVLDYLETDKIVDARKVGIEGLSRYGKAALVTIAFDTRFAIGFIGSSGAAGAKLHRRIFGEQIENIASEYEYHWMCGNYIKYAGQLTANDLPVDSHELIALCAPRPIFIGVGSPEVEGNWIDAKGMFLAAVHAAPVYKLLGKKDLGVSEYPAMGTKLISGDIGFHQHFGGHTNAPNWETFLEFAKKYIE